MATLGPVTCGLASHEETNFRVRIAQKGEAPQGNKLFRLSGSVVLFEREQNEKDDNRDKDGSKIEPQNKGAPGTGRKGPWNLQVRSDTARHSVNT